MSQKPGVVYIFLLLLLLAGCDYMQKKALMQDRYPSYPVDIQQAVKKGQIVEGMHQEQVFLALGPTVCKTTGYYGGKPVDIWSYVKHQQPVAESYAGTYDCLKADFKVYFENGRVIGWADQ
ncbi:MAG: hypothetical protein RDU01_08250 [Thermodesulfovibrionales bacterium]|nr:hypothetical protein [Thermodesulfovibrionales bacterium]